MSNASEIVTSQSGQRMLSYVAPIYYQSRVAMAIFQPNGVEIDALAEWVDEIKAQLFPQSATWGLKYWEEVLGLQSNEAFPNKTRRQAILSKLVMRVPITPAKLKEIAQQSTNMPAKVESQISPSTFRVIIESLGGLNIETLNTVIQNAKPAHLTAEYGIEYKERSISNIGTAIVTGQHYTIHTE